MFGGNGGGVIGNETVPVVVAVDGGGVAGVGVDAPLDSAVTTMKACTTPTSAMYTEAFIFSRDELVGTTFRCSMLIRAVALRLTST